MKALLAIDVGTSSVKACVFDGDLRRMGTAHFEYALETPSPGCVELDPESCWRAALASVLAAVRSAGLRPSDLAALAVTTQGETLVPVDVRGMPLRKAIVWLDGRADDEARTIAGIVTDREFHAVTGIPGVAPSCPLCKVLRLRDREPFIWERTHRVMLLLDYLLLRLTGRFATDRCLVSSTGYFDLRSGRVWRNILDRNQLGSDWIPDALPCGAPVGEILPSLARDHGFDPHLVVVSGGMDQAASAVGAGNLRMGMVTETTGTALVVAATIDDPDFVRYPLNVMRHAVEGRFLALPYDPTAGIVLKWFRDVFCREEVVLCAQEGRSSYECIDALAAEVPTLAGGLVLFPHFAGMLAPVVDPEVRGAFLGIGLDSGKGHFARAILEGVAYLLREKIDLLAESGIRPHEVVSLGGGARSPLWLGIKASVLRRPVLVPAESESTALGAAMLASVAIGGHRTLEEAADCVRISDRHDPLPSEAAAYEEGYACFRTLYQVLKGLPRSSP